ncbi:MAG: LacI family DNA-binding transcriptional regulator [Eubacteriales bacterium]|jgi:LacI family transcriptional regulator|nr:LacI family DNA-binding transcriptional regulator [Eubacteriales bacterium]MDD4105170.1 LacI family DNA-binding transcriptional regulator [Eubacteriales bacterium]MDD4710767.1 LacI family DNA-binding transcriptional regulator [Eubacteriales bacterium]NLO14519.1 LacI family transcriptional regulator [Clostridiales bacterium]
MQKKRQEGRVTLRDIARKTGYTMNTVSRALNNKPDISKETSLKIQQAARDAGYIRNWMAGSLRTGRSNTIAVIVCDLSNPFFALMVADIEAAAAEFGYTVIVLCTHEIQEKEENAIRVAIGRQVDGILLCPCQGSGDSIGLLHEAGLPYVLVSRHFSAQETDALICDEKQGGFLAAEHLIKAGHKKLVFLSSFDRVSSVAERRSGFVLAAEQYGIPKSDCLVFHHEDGEKTAAFLKEKQALGFTGVFAYCDMEAWKVITCLAKEGVRIPEDLAFTAFDNIQGRLGFPFSLCSIESSLLDICRGSVKLLDEKINGSAPPHRLSVYPVSLVCRGSCGNHS